eukprot:Amastigsp_a840983_32.p5 type:complete len:101 gc:universal Amastigsp_a840983_32:1086-784(-)
MRRTRVCSVSTSSCRSSRSACSRSMTWTLCWTRCSADSSRPTRSLRSTSMCSRHTRAGARASPWRPPCAFGTRFCSTGSAPQRCSSTSSCVCSSSSRSAR